MERIICIFVFFCLFGSDEASPYRQKMVIDHDGGADDAYAIAMAFQYETFFYGPNVVAITTSYGNVNLTQAIINSGRILSLVDRNDVPVYSGASQCLIQGIESDYYFGYDGLGDFLESMEPVQVEKEHAAIALIELSKKYKGELVVVALGPLTNIALAIRLDPMFISRLAHLYVGGGHLFSKDHPGPEFNAEMDVEAYYIVADGAVADIVTFVPFSQVYKSLTITKEWRTDVFGSIQTPLVQTLTSFERVSLPSSESWTLLDPVVSAIALDNSIVTDFKLSKNSISTCGENRGVNTNYFNHTEPNSRIVYKADLQKYKDFLLTVFSADMSPSTEHSRKLIN
ncbi:probable uridine nucleosidase 1 isoform X2 [Trichoplusia ni]|uniref:Probable uridine nucleosidase 1 isoform X2 n=1 Tax=Trichoplusia ni TaxID=7111 RepID=A0A7E5VDV3_TRINI|nr:probable uridine nucleosidase 1 isoform X2 [Trichoplusia ni]